MKLDTKELEDLADQVAAVLARRAGPPDTYTTSALPPDATRRTFHRVCPDVPGAKKFGRSWSVPRAAWEAHRAVGKAATPDVKDLAAAALAKAGFRKAG